MGRKISNFFLYTTYALLIVVALLIRYTDYAKRQLLQKSKGSV
jgi:hypothetical protein